VKAIKESLDKPNSTIGISPGPAPLDSRYISNKNTEVRLL